MVALFLSSPGVKGNEQAELGKAAITSGSLLGISKIPRCLDDRGVERGSA